MNTAQQDTAQHANNPGAAAPRTLASASAIRLVAGRELMTRLRSKVFRIMTLLVLVVIIGMVLVFKLAAASGTGTTHIGVVAGSSVPATAVEQAAQQAGQQWEVTTVPDTATAREQVRDGSLDVALVPARAPDVTAMYESTLDPTVRTALTAVVHSMVLDRQISDLGGDPAAVRAAADRAQLIEQALTPPHHYDVTALVLGIATGILIYLSLQLGGQLVAQGVVEEKSSRVVELLLATIRPWELMAGKVVGIGLLGLIQVAIVGAVGVAFAVSMGVLSLTASAALTTVIWLIVWYLVGFTMYAFAFAAAGAMVSRQEDAAGVILPVLSFVLVGYILGVSILPGDPSNTFMEVLSVIPLFAPTVMPVRLAMGGVPVWEAALALVLSLATIPALAVLAGRIYRNAIIHLGARVSLRTALGGGRSR